MERWEWFRFLRVEREGVWERAGLYLCGLWNASVGGRPAYRHDSRGVGRLDSGRRGTYHGPRLSLYPSPPSPCRGRGPCRRRTSIWVALDCAWLATETAVKSGEKVLPSYVACPVSRTCLFVPYCESRR